jgi:hypothetical protein
VISRGFLAFFVIKGLGHAIGMRKAKVKTPMREGGKRFKKQVRKRP